MAVLILNIGSATIKWAVFEKGWQEEGTKYIKNFDSDLNKILMDIKRKYFINAVGYRIVHGGDIERSAVLNGKILKKLNKFTEIAPLHETNELKGTGISRKIFSTAKHIAVFDTSFHSTMPEKAKIYAIPLEFYKNGIKRYGFHGISHKYVAEKVMKSLKAKKLRLVSCHFGAGCSITAIKDGKSIDTSMGFTPLDGIMMMTRSGSIDPGILIYLMKQGYNHDKLNKLLNENSGLKGISGIGDMRDLIKSNKKESKLAVDIFCYLAAKQIAAYSAALNGIDAIAFTGGIGENEKHIREKILKQLKFLKAKMFIIKANEKEIILKEVLNLL